MKVLLNASNLVEGGAIKIAVEFIQYTLDSECCILWDYALSKEIKYQLDLLGIELNQSHKVLNQSPSRSLSSRKILLAY